MANFFNKKGILIYDIPEMPDWDDVEKICRYLEVHFDAICVSKINGPDSRRFIMALRDVVLEIHHEDPWGNSIVSINPTGDLVLREIASDLNSHLEGM